MRYLIAETNWALMSLSHDLTERGVLLTRTDRPEDLLHFLEVGESDLVLVDAEALGAGGPSVAQLRAAAGPDTAVVVMAPKGGKSKTAQWLDAGADTVIAADTPAAEIHARLQAVVRRLRGLATPILQVGSLSIDLNARRADLGGVALHLSPKIYELLEYIALRPGVVIKRTALLSHIYGLENEPDARVFDVYVCGLRNQLAACAGDIQIETVRGQGFRFVTQIEEVAARAA